MRSYCITFFILFFFAAHPANAQSVPDVSDLTYLTEDLPPYNYQNDGEAHGIAVDVLKMVWKELGISERHIHFQPWGRAYDTTLHQPGHVLFTTLMTEYRAPLFKWVGPIAHFHISLMAVKTRKIEVASSEALADLHLGVVNGYASTELLEKMGARHMEQHPNPQLHIRKLVNGRIDAVSMERLCFIDCVEKLNLDPNLFEPVWDIKTYMAGFAFNRETPDVVIESFQQALDKVRETDDYKKLVEYHTH